MRKRLRCALERPLLLGAAAFGVLSLTGACSPAPAVVPTLAATVQAEPTPAPEPQPSIAPPAIEPTQDVPSAFAGIDQPPPAPPKRTGLATHTVAPDEVLWQIAEQYNLRSETILWANDIDNPDLLLVGQHLVIPPEDGVMYTVRPGDSLADIAGRYGIDVQAILNNNATQLADPDQIQAGADIFLPGARPLANATSGTVDAPSDDQAEAATNVSVLLPDNIDALLHAGWLRAQGITQLYKAADPNSSRLNELPGGARLERLDGFRAGRIQVRDPGDGRTRQAMTGWVNASDLDVGRTPATRELPLAYPADTAMDISHVFAPYRSQLDGAPYAEANCGPTAVGMALDAFGVNVTPRQLRAEALDAQHMYGNNVGTLITALAAVVDEHGLSAVDLRDGGGDLRHWSLDDVRAHVQQGEPVVVQVRYRSLPGRGGALYFGDHYILVTGVVGDGFLYNDPIDVDGLGWDRVISGAALKNAMNASDGRYAYTAFGVSR